MTLLAVALLLGLVPAAIAHNKGRTFFSWWLYGTLLFIVAFPHALLLRPDTAEIEHQAIIGGGMKRCPACAELVRREATKCRFCQTALS
jgi:hypothetical protein